MQGTESTDSTQQTTPNTLHLSKYKQEPVLSCTISLSLISDLSLFPSTRKLHPKPLLYLPHSGSISTGQMGTTPESVGALTLLVSLDMSVFGNSSSLFWLKQKEEILLWIFSGAPLLEGAASGEKKKKTVYKPVSCRTNTNSAKHSSKFTQLSLCKKKNKFEELVFMPYCLAMKFLLDTNTFNITERDPLYFNSSMEILPREWALIHSCSHPTWMSEFCLYP